jgi:sugar lactone lactonase YvrE
MYIQLPKVVVSDLKDADGFYSSAAVGRKHPAEVHRLEGNDQGQRQLPQSCVSTSCFQRKYLFPLA